MAPASRFTAFALGAALCMPAALGAQQPRIINGQMAAQPAGSPFAGSFQSLVAAQGDVAWIGYAVPAVRREGTMCCFTSGTTHISGNVVMSDGTNWTSGCRIEPGSQARPAAAGAPQTPAGPVKLEGSDRLIIMFRVAERRVERIRMFSEDCELDAGGRPVRWLDNVRPADSIALLQSFVGTDAEKRDRIANGALSALAMHAAAEAGQALERLARTHEHGSIRGEALFWLAQRGEPGAQKTILQAIESDTSPDVRKRAVFALSQLKDDAAVPALVQVARHHATSAVRGEAIFWLGQKAGKRASSEITDRIENDPDTDVKKRAVFALSQLPKDEGVPLLIKVARTHANSAVRKQAMFWLGQSKDPRAVEFFAEILK